MFKKTAIVAGIGLALSATAQADYRWELGGAYSHGSVDSELKTPNGTTKNDTDIDVGNIFGTFYLWEVDTSKGPLGEAAFLDHASSITLAATDGEVDFSDIDNQDGQNYAVSTRYVAEGPGWQLSGLIVDLGYERQEPGDQEIDIYNVGVGYYVTPKTTVVVGYEQTNVNDGGDVDTYRVDGKHLWSLSGDGAITAELGYGRTTIKNNDDVDAYLVAGKWYLNKSLSFGLGYENTDWNGYEVNTVSVSSEWFITESFEVSLAYSYESPDDIKVDLGDFGGRSKLEVDTETFTIGALYRF